MVSLWDNTVTLLVEPHVPLIKPTTVAADFGLPFIGSQNIPDYMCSCNVFNRFHENLFQCAGIF